MIRLDGSQAQHLILGRLDVNPRLARRLPPAVACRYHALPVAEDGGHITIAMADPDDTLAREAVLEALGAPSCVVAGNPATIDALLAEVWPEALQRSLNLLACTWDGVANETLAFAQSVADLLAAHLSYYYPLARDEADCADLARAVEQGCYDLVFWEEAGQCLGRRLISGPTFNRVRKHTEASVLVVRRPRWPLKRLLLLVQDGERDEPALDWVVRLARPSGASVTALAVTPPAPAMYGQLARMQQGLDAVLATTTPLGQQMRRVARWLVEWDVQATLLLRQGLPEHEIRREVDRGDYDLIVVSDQYNEWWRRCLNRDWSACLPAWANQPVLFAKPFAGARDCADEEHDCNQAVDVEHFLEVHHV
jgi:nucleotide-binding universal stress UspA family protein